MAKRTPPKRGDWVCCARRPAHANDQPQLNYAANEGCARPACEATRACGLSYDEVQALLSGAPEPRSAAAHEKKKKKKAPGDAKQQQPGAAPQRSTLSTLSAAR